MSLPTVSQTRFGFVRQYPTDLALLSVGAIVAYYLVTTFPAGSYVRIGVTLPLLLFLPGYALTSTLFPANARAAREQTETIAASLPGGIDTVERFGLAFALSLALLPMLVIALALTEWHLTTESVAVSVTVLTILFAQIGVVRRFRVPEPDRYTLSPGATFARIRGTTDESAFATVTSILLVLGIVAAGLALVVALVAPLSAGGFTELGLYTEDEDGSLIADGFPSELEPNESVPLVLTIENNEGEEKEYTVVVQEEVVEDGEVVERTELREINARMGDGQSVAAERNITPETDDGTVRITFLLFDDDDGEPPTDPTANDAVEDVYFWTTVGEEEAELEEEETETDEDNETDFTIDDGDDGDENTTADDDDAAVDDDDGDDDDADADETEADEGDDDDADTDDTEADDDDDDDDDDDEPSILEQLFGDDDGDDDDDDD